MVAVRVRPPEAMDPIAVDVYAARSAQFSVVAGAASDWNSSTSKVVEAGVPAIERIALQDEVLSGTNHVLIWERVFAPMEVPMKFVLPFPSAPRNIPFPSQTRVAWRAFEEAGEPEGTAWSWKHPFAGIATLCVPELFLFDPEMEKKETVVVAPVRSSHRCVEVGAAFVWMRSNCQLAPPAGAVARLT